MGLLNRHLHQGNDVGTGLLVHFEHPGQKRIPWVNHVITEHHCKTVWSNVALGSKDGVTQAARVSLPGVVNVG